jgi:hypothetical protein
MRQLRLLLLLLCAPGLSLAAALPPAATNWDRITVAPMKTSIYVGSVTLTTGDLVRAGSSLAATYDARVFPWFFWSETGRIKISLTDEVLAHLAKGETAEFSGDALNHKGKPRAVTGRAQPTDPTSGKIKVRIKVDDVELIFNGRYQFSGPQRG